MHQVTKQYRTETGHRLMAYDGKCSHLHGHSYLWEVTAQAHSLTDNGMVVDFKDLKEAMKLVLEPFDHAMVLANNDPACHVIDQMPATNAQPQRLIRVPFNPTAENFAKYAGSEISKLLPIGVTVSKVVVWETATSFAEWRNNF